MKLILRLTDHDDDTGQSRTLETGRMSIGRGPQNDWVLADPDRTLSKIHCRIDASDGHFMLTDLSTNGVFMTGTSQPIGRGHSVALEDGESFSIGPYKLTAEIVGQSGGLMLDQGLGLPDADPETVFAGGSGRPSTGLSPLTPSISEPWLTDVPGGEFGPGRRAAPQGWDAPPDPATYAASGMFEQSSSGTRPMTGNPFTGSDLFSQTSEHVPAASTVMRIPESQVVLPTDWMEADPMEQVAEAPHSAPPALWPPALPDETPSLAQDAAPAASPAVSAPAAQLPADWIVPETVSTPRLPAGWDPAPAEPPPPVSVLAPPPDPVTFKPPMPAIAPKPPVIEDAPAPAIVAAPPVATTIKPTLVAPTPASQAPPIMRPSPRPQRPAPASRPAQVPPQPVPPPPQQAAPPSAPSHGGVARAFLDGAGLPPDTLDGVDTEAAFYEIGQMVRAAVEGVRDVLSTRALVKSEFRVDQTVLRRSDNNAVKFAPDVQRCLAAMVGASPPGFLPGPAAMQQSMDDIKAHELALVAALNSVFADMGQQLDPEAIMRRARQDTGFTTMLPYAREAKCWAIYTETYRLLQDSGAANTAGSLLAPLAQAYARQLRRGG